MRLLAACLFAGAAACALVAALALGLPRGYVVALPAGILLTAVPIALAPTARMPFAWFYVLPLLIAAETGIAMWALAPDVGVASVTCVFVGALVGFIGETPRVRYGILVATTAVLLSPVIAGEATTPATLTVAAVTTAMWGLAEIIAMVWAHAEDAATRLDELAQRDALTGVGNRRMLDERLDYELVRHTRSGEALALVVLDLNGFKAINDRLGHNAGDDVLRDVALALAGAVRAQDTVARPGGDEFCVLAPRTDDHAAEQLVARIRTALERIEEQAIGAGIGYAVFPDDARTARALFEIADARQRADKPGQAREPLARSA